MVQKEKAKRGRPRRYDPATALAKATSVFWDSGFAATSLDDLSAATGMNRPSLYGAFGDKRALYLAAVEGYRAAARAALAEALAPGRALREGFALVYAKALALYLSGESSPRGCFLIGTAATEAVLDAEVRAAFRDGLREIEAAFEARIRLARAVGELGRAAAPGALARLATAYLHTLAVRARAGEPRASLEAIAREAVELICGPTKRVRRRASEGMRRNSR